MKNFLKVKKTHVSIYYQKFSWPRNIFEIKQRELLLKFSEKYMSTCTILITVCICKWQKVLSGVTVSKLLYLSILNTTKEI